MSYVRSVSRRNDHGDHPTNSASREREKEGGRKAYLQLLLRRHGAPRALLPVPEGGIKNLNTHGVPARLNVVAGRDWSDHIVILRVGGSAAAAAAGGFADGGGHHADFAIGRGGGMVPQKEGGGVTGRGGGGRAGERRLSYWQDEGLGAGHRGGGHGECQEGGGYHHALSYAAVGRIGRGGGGGGRGLRAGASRRHGDGFVRPRHLCGCCQMEWGSKAEASGAPFLLLVMMSVGFVF